MRFTSGELKERFRFVGNWRDSFVGLLLPLAPACCFRRPTH